MRSLSCSSLTSSSSSLSYSQAEDGKEAVEQMKRSIEEQSPYNFIFMDYVMPNMSGPEATSEIRHLGYRNPIIGVTGNAYEEAKMSFLDSGATTVLVKPINKMTLTKILNSKISTMFPSSFFLMMS
jgi:CheY-like chemotaxis protein